MPITARGAYTRAGAAEPDAEILAAAQALIRAIPLEPAQDDLMAPPLVGGGVDWGAMGLPGVPDWVDETHPGLIALREIEPPPPRPWRATARPVQIAAAESRATYILLQGGRGAGKTFTGANTLSEWCIAEPGTYAVIAPTFSDCRQFCVEGPSGLLRALGDDLISYDKSKNELHVCGGSLIIMASDEAPKRLRGPNFTGIWADELGSWRNLKETWEDGVEFATRIGSSRRLITGTPRRGNYILKELNARAARGDPDVLLLRGSTMDNAANLSKKFLETVYERHHGTHLGRQELDGELLDEVEGALVTMALIDSTRVSDGALVPILRRVVVGIDPSVTLSDTSDACGIVVAGLGPAPMSDWSGAAAKVEGTHLYFLADHTMRGTPRAWAIKALQVADDWSADAMIVETNQGGDLCTTMLRMVAAEMQARTPRIVKVHASVGKRTRAEPVAGVFEQCRAHIVGGLPGVEDGFTSWVPGDPESPNELDACLVAGTLILTGAGEVPIEAVRVGDWVRTRRGLRPVTWSGCTREAARTYEVETDGEATIEATGDHRVWTQRGWVRVDALLWGDTMLKWSGSLLSGSPGPDFVAVAVRSVRATGRARRVYDLMVAEDHEFVAGGLLVHNCVWAAVGLMPQLAMKGPSPVRVIA